MYNQPHFKSTGDGRHDKISKVYANHNESYLRESSSINLPSPPPSNMLMNRQALKMVSQSIVISA